MEKLLHKHWFNLITVTIALVALVLSYQANQIARSETIAQIERVSSQTFEYSLHAISACKEGDPPNYRLDRYFESTQLFANRGGRAADLIGFDATQNIPGFAPYSEWYDMKVFGNNDATTGSWERLTVPVTLAPGTSRLWKFELHRFSDNTNSGNHTVEDINASIEFAKQTWSPVIWTYYFSDGTIIEKSYGESLEPSQPFDESFEC